MPTGLQASGPARLGRTGPALVLLSLSLSLSAAFRLPVQVISLGLIKIPRIDVQI